MSYSNISQRPTILIYQRFVDLFERLEPFDHFTERRMLPVEVRQVVSERKEELRPCSSIVVLTSDGHRQRTRRDVFHFRKRFWHEKIVWRIVFGRFGQQMPDARAAVAGIVARSSLGDKVFQNVVEAAEIVFVDLA